MGDKRRAQQAAPLQIQIGRWGVGKVARFLEFLYGTQKTGRSKQRPYKFKIRAAFERKECVS
jgi:hypothetical protein